MNFSISKLFAVVLLAVAIGIDVVLTLDDMKCKGMDITMTEVQIKNIKDCATKFGVSSAAELTPDKIGCFAKCVMEKKGLVDEAGKPHKENINNLIDSTMPETVRADIKSKFEECLTKHGSKIDAAEAKCLSYVPLAMCTHKAILEVCKS